MTVIISFAVGAVLMLPFTFGRKKKKPQKSAPAQQNSANQTQPKEESKTLFDFKIKRDVKTENEKSKSENSEKPKKDKKSLFGFGKKKEAKSADSAKSNGTENSSGNGTASLSESHSSDAETGAPV